MTCPVRHRRRHQTNSKPMVGRLPGLQPLRAGGCPSAHAWTDQEARSIRNMPKMAPVNTLPDLITAHNAHEPTSQLDATGNPNPPFSAKHDLTPLTAQACLESKELLSLPQTSNMHKSCLGNGIAWLSPQPRPATHHVSGPSPTRS